MACEKQFGNVVEKYMLEIAWKNSVELWFGNSVCAVFGAKNIGVISNAHKTVILYAIASFAYFQTVPFRCIYIIAAVKYIKLDTATWV